MSAMTVWYGVGSLVRFRHACACARSCASSRASSRASSSFHDASSDGKPQVTDRQEVAATRWLALDTLSYRDAKGNDRKWDMVRRTTRNENADADAVAIFTKMYKEGEPVRTIVVRQFRPPLNCHTIELPAGLLDAGETASEAALRELKEETGYTAVVEHVSPPLSLSAGLTDECIRLVTCTVDLDAAVNADPKQALDDTESIEVSVVAVKDLRGFLDKASERGDVVFAGLYHQTV